MTNPPNFTSILNASEHEIKNYATHLYGLGVDGTVWRYSGEFGSPTPPAWQPTVDPAAQVIPDAVEATARYHRIIDKLDERLKEAEAEKTALLNIIEGYRKQYAAYVEQKDRILPVIRQRPQIY